MKLIKLCTCELIEDGRPLQHQQQRYRGTETVVVCKCLVVIVSGRGGCWWLRNKQEHRQDDVQNEERCKLPLTASLASAVVDPLQGGGDGSVDEEVMWSDDDDDDGVVARTHCPALHALDGGMDGWMETHQSLLLQ